MLQSQQEHHEVSSEELIENLKDEIQTFRQKFPSIQADARHLHEYQHQVSDLLSTCNDVIYTLEGRFTRTEYLERVKKHANDLRGILNDAERRQREAERENSMKMAGPQERASTPAPEIEEESEEARTPKQQDYVEAS